MALETNSSWINLNVAQEDMTDNILIPELQVGTELTNFVDAFNLGGDYVVKGYTVGKDDATFDDASVPAVTATDEFEIKQIKIKFENGQLGFIKTKLLADATSLTALETFVLGLPATGFACNSKPVKVDFK